MIATGTTLGCGMSICLAVFTADTQAMEAEPTKPVPYHFGEWTVIVQPGRSSRPSDVPVVATRDEQVSTSRIQLTNFVQLPPPPLPPEGQLAAEVAVDAALQPADAVTPASADHEESSASKPAVNTDVLARAHLYREVYNSIPFSRAEFNANPSYRHDATMEFLFGQMRPTVIHRPSTTHVDVNMPAMPYGGFGGYGSGLFYNRYGLYNNWSPYMYPPYRW